MLYAKTEIFTEAVASLVATSLNTVGGWGGAYSTRPRVLQISLDSFQVVVRVQPLVCTNHKLPYNRIRNFQR